MNNKWFFRVACLFVGIVIGVSAVAVIKNIRKTEKAQEVPEVAITELESLGVWDSISEHYENQLGIVFNNYYSIYNTASLDSYAKSQLAPYFEKYGYDAVLCSGLKANNKFSNIYCVELCCELYGDERLVSKDSVKKYLDGVKINTNPVGRSDEEPKYTELAQKRLALARALYSNDFSASSDIVQNSDGSVAAWICNMYDSKARVRICDNGLFYNADAGFGGDVSLEFLEDDVLGVRAEGHDNNACVVKIGENIGVYDICGMLKEYNRKQESEELGKPVNYDTIEPYVTQMSCKNAVLSGNCYGAYTQEQDEGALFAIEYRFEIDLNSATVLKLESEEDIIAKG